MSRFIKYVLYLVVWLVFFLLLARVIPFDRLYHRGEPSMIQVMPAEIGLDTNELFFYNIDILSVKNREGKGAYPVPAEKEPPAERFPAKRMHCGPGVACLKFQ